MIRDNKISGYIERIYGDERPITADIFLTDFCNARCSYCRYNNESGKFITFENFKIYVDRLLELGVNGFILTGGGEPTINKDFDKITNWLEQQKLLYGINTNLIKPIKCSPVFVKISIDVGNNERYKSVKGVDRLDSVIKNVRDFVAYKKENNLETNIGVQCVAINQHDTLEFYNLIKDIDVDYIYIRPLENVNGNDISEIDVRRWFVNINDERVNFSFKFKLKDYRAYRCLGNWSVITVNCDGNVPYCCHFPNNIVGNILDDDILEKKKIYNNVDYSRCEIPCRLSGVNYYLEMNKNESDYAFV